MIIDGKENLYQIGEKTFHCGTHVTMELIGGKWKCIILWYLRHGETRFSALKKYMPDITEKMLSIQLRALENDQFISKSVIGEKPPLKVYYQLTNLGTSLLPIIELMTNWGDSYGLKNGKLINTK